MHVLSAGAGSDKGLVALPDVGDRVLILFPRDAMGEGVVLGGLYGTTGTYDSGVEAGKVRRYTLRTPAGQRVILDDAHQRLRVEDQTGSYVELGPEKVQVHAAVDLDIEAPGRSVVIRAQAIDFERG
jgi:phage baseplate assembly protein gpV